MAFQRADGTTLQQDGNTNFKYADNPDGTKNVGSPVIDNFIKGLFGGGGPSKSSPNNFMLPTVQIGTTAPTPQLGAQMFPQQTDNDPGNMDMDLTGESSKVPATASNTANYAQNIALQNMLNNEGAALAVDGIRGPLTEAANNAYMARGQDDPDYSGLSAMDLTGDGMNNDPQSRQPDLPETVTKTEPSRFKNPFSGLGDSFMDSQKAIRELMENNKTDRDAKRNNTINQNTSADSAITSADIADLLSGNPSETNPLVSFDPDFLFDEDFTSNDVDIQPVPLETSDMLRDEGPSTDFLTSDTVAPTSADVQQIRLLQELMANGDTNSVQQILASMPPDKAAAMIQQLAQ